MLTWMLDVKNKTDFLDFRVEYLNWRIISECPVLPNRVFVTRDKANVLSKLFDASSAPAATNLFHVRYHESQKYQ